MINRGWRFQLLLRSTGFEITVGEEYHSFSGNIGVTVGFKYIAIIVRSNRSDMVGGGWIMQGENAGVSLVQI